MGSIDIGIFHPDWISEARFHSTLHSTARAFIGTNNCHATALTAVFQVGH